jgi:hypothetical protein
MFLFGDQNRTSAFFVPSSRQFHLLKTQERVNPVLLSSTFLVLNLATSTVPKPFAGGQSAQNSLPLFISYRKMSPYGAEDDDESDTSFSSEEFDEDPIGREDEEDPADEEDLADEEGEVLPPEEDFRTGTIPLNLARRYRSGWIEPAALREFIQNWFVTSLVTET